MKNRILIFIIYLLISSTSIFLLSCTKSTEPIQYLKLVIENGFYKRIESINPNEIQYEIEFTYYVTGEECNWGGYSIQMDSHAWKLDLYRMQLMTPNEKYTWIDTFIVNHELLTKPIVQMQAYRIGSSELYKELYAEYILKQK
ncbi:MAG: hypothetical protein P8X42_06820 [Calditrichaceae bacterium]